MEEAAWEVAQYALIVDEEAGEASERLDIESILLWVLFKHASNVDMEVFGDIYTGLNEFIDLSLIHIKMCIRDSSKIVKVLAAQARGER